MSPRSLIPRLAVGIALLGLVLVAIGPLGIHSELWAPLTGFLIFAGGLLFSGPLSLVLGGWGLLLNRGSKQGSTRLLSVPMLTGFLVTLYLVVKLASVSDVPPIHDITTNTKNPPEFLQAIQLPENRGRSLDYPDGGDRVPELQRQAYPDLAPIRLSEEPARVFEAALQSARDVGWETTWFNRSLLRFEAIDRTAVFHFVDDIALRVLALPGGGSLVDLRSTSRDGVSDLGANAARIRAFEVRLKEVLGGDRTDS